MSTLEDEVTFTSEQIREMFAKRPKVMDPETYRKAIRKASGGVFAVMRPLDKHGRVLFVRISKVKAQELGIWMDPIYVIKDGRQLFIGWNPEDKWID